MSSTNLTPKEKMLASRRAQTQVFDGVSRPLAQELKDPEKIRRLYSTWPIVPFLEGSDMTIDVLELCQSFSPTNGGILRRIQDFVLGGEFEVIYKKRGGLTRHQEDKDREVSKEESLVFWDFVEQAIKGDDLLDVASALFTNYKTYGNGYVEVSSSIIGGEWQINIINHDAPYCRYLSTLPGEPKTILISSLWDLDYLAKYPPDAVAVHPAFTTDENGVRRTIIHMKNKVPNHDWYGLPDWLCGLYSAFMEIEMGEYGIDEYGNRNTPQIIVETEDDLLAVDDEADTEEGISFKEGMRSMFTNSGGGRSRFLHRSRPRETGKMDVWFVPPNQDHNFHRFMSEVTERQLMKAHAWHPILSVSTIGKLGSGTEFKEILRMIHQTTVRRLQKRLSRVIDKVLEIVSESLGQEELTQKYSISFANLFAEMMVEDPTVETEQPAEIDPAPTEDPSTE